MRAMSDDRILFKGSQDLKTPQGMPDETITQIKDRLQSILDHELRAYELGRVSYEANRELMAEIKLRRLQNEIWESLVFQNLLPAFDKVPMRRVFPICFYTKETWTVGFDALVRAVILTSGCELKLEYPFLEGSGVYRGALRTSKRHTRKQFENSQAQLAVQIVETLKQDKNVGGVTVNFNFGSPNKEKEQKGEWSGKFKDFTEGIRNLILAGAGLVFIFDGTLMTSSQSGSPHQISITQIDRQAELQALPKILDATSPQEFHEAIEPLDDKKSQRPTTIPAPGRKFR